MTVPRQELEMTPPCTECKLCKLCVPNETEEVWYYCEFDECFISEEYALSDLECDAFEQKLDDNETKRS